MEKILIFVIILNKQISLNQALTPDGTGVCTKTSVGGYAWLQCCPGYVQKSNLCEVCPNGTTGENCHFKCPINHFGLRCLSVCNCGTKETCDRIVGCTKLTSSGSTIITDSQNNESIITSSSTVTIVVIVVVAVVLLGLSLIVWKQKLYMQCSSIDINIMSCLSENRLVFQSRTKELTAQEDDENPYSEIRESMMVRPMTIYGRRLSILRTSYTNPVDQYHHLSIKSSHRGKNYIMDITDSSWEYVDPVDEEVSRMHHFINSNHCEQCGTKVKEVKLSCRNAFVDKKQETEGNKRKSPTGNESLDERNKELYTTDCNSKDESDPQSFPRYSCNIECEHVEDQSYMDTFKNESDYTQDTKLKENVGAHEYTDLILMASEALGAISKAKNSGYTKDQEYTETSKDHEYTKISKGHGHTKISKGHERTEISKGRQYTEISNDQEYTEISKDHEYTEISKDHEYTEISKSHECTKVFKGNDYTEISQGHEYTEISNDQEYTDISKDHEYADISKGLEYTEISKDQEYTEISKRHVYTKVFKGNEYTEVSSDQEYTEISDVANNQ